jgi:hypothetical protein
MDDRIVVVECELDAVTKNTVRYAEIGSTHIRTIYVEKALLKEPYPTRIEVIVRVVNNKEQLS